jgi:DHA3 family macrolide efflux protein-like MFS transporter
VWGGFRKRVHTALSALVVEGIAIALVGVAPAKMFLLAIAGMFVGGLTNALVNGPFMAVMQGVVSPEKQGRVFNLVGSLCAAAWPLSLAAAGPIADAVGVRPWYVAGGIVCAVTGVVAFFVPLIANLEQNGRAGSAELDTREVAEAAQAP